MKPKTEKVWQLFHLQHNLNVHSLKLFNSCQKVTRALHEVRKHKQLKGKNKTANKPESISKIKVYFHNLMSIPEI